MSTWPDASVLLDLVRLLGGDEARQGGHAHRQALEALGEHAVVLADQQRGGGQQCHLLARHGGDEGRAQGHLGLAEADVAAQQPVHRLAGGHVLEHGLDGGQLVLGLLVGEPGGELLVDAVRQVAAPCPGAVARSAATLISSPASSRMRSLTLALRDCQPTPPSRSSTASWSAWP